MPRARLGITAHHISHDPGGNDVILTHVLDRAIADTDVTNTAVETDVYRKTIPGNTISSTGNLRLTISGDSLHNAVQNCRLRVYFGGVALLDTGNFAPAANAARHFWKMVIELQAAGATNAQRMYGMWFLTPVIGAYAAVAWSTADYLGGEGYATGASDTTLAQDLAVTCLWGAALATLSWRLHQAFLESFR